MEYVSLLAPISFVFALAALTQVGSLTEKRSREVKKRIVFQKVILILILWSNRY